MGNNCSCLHGGKTDEKQLNTEINPVEIEKNMIKPLEFSNKTTDFKENSVDLRVELREIIFLQSVLRGYIERRKIKEVFCTKLQNWEKRDQKGDKMMKNEENRRNSDEFIRNFVNEINLNDVPDYSNSATKLIQMKLGQFIYREATDPDLIKRGPVKMENDAIYIGEWQKENKRHGKGLQKWSDGSAYEGYWKFDKANGKGRLIHTNGDVYEGDWKDDRAHGHGIYIHTDGAKYEGSWEYDKQHGFGIEVWPDGAKYQGLYENGQKNGLGRFEWADGSVYEGNFSQNNIQGQGNYTWSDGRKFVGEWKNNKMHGKGLFTWNDGRSYDGEYLDDKKHGFGIFVWPDGRKYEGSWMFGKQNGRGTYFTPSGESKEGEWKDGKRVSSISF